MCAHCDVRAEDSGLPIWIGTHHRLESHPCDAFRCVLVRVLNLKVSGFPGTIAACSASAHVLGAWLLLLR